MNASLTGLASTTTALPASAHGPTRTASTQAIAAAAPPNPVGANANPAADMVVSTAVTAVSPPGYTQTVTTRADGVVTTTITNDVGAVMSTTTSHTASVGTATGVSASSVSLWA
jgi:hypothetical protein